MSHPIDVFRFCPRCGSSGFRAMGKKSFFCESCGFNYYINSAAAVACLITDLQGRLLLTRRAIEPHKGMLDLPGGFVDPLETAEEAVKRELMEELGMEVKSLRYITSQANEYLYSGITVFTTDLAFHVEPVSFGKLVANDDISGYEWLYPAEIDLGKIPAPSIRYFVKIYCDL